MGAGGREWGLVSFCEYECRKMSAAVEKKGALQSLIWDGKGRHARLRCESSYKGMNEMIKYESSYSGLSAVTKVLRYSKLYNGVQKK